jgi:hypothetical protein
MIFIDRFIFEQGYQLFPHIHNFLVILGGIIQHHCTDSVIDHAVIIEGFDMSGMYISRIAFCTNFFHDYFTHTRTQ